MASNKERQLKTGAGPETQADTRVSASASVEHDFDPQDQLLGFSRFKWENLTYATRATASFALIAIMTAVIAVGVLSFVWARHFDNYTQENMQSLAESMASRIEEVYEETGSLYDSRVIAVAEYGKSLSAGVGIMISDNITGNVVYDSALVEAEGKKPKLTDPLGEVVLPGQDAVPPLEEGGSQVPSTGASAGSEAESALTEESLTPINSLNGEFESALIEHDGVAIGSVRVWVYGSEVLLTQADQEFRDNSYRAMIIATIIAIVLASCIGFLFARNLVAPINRMTSTARSIKEGNLHARTGLHGEDEVARLGETFDAMADAIERDRELERRLTTDVAHELRTPLMAIQSTVEAMVDGVFAPDEERLETVNSEVQRLSRLVDAILKLSRLENRSKPLNLAVLDVGKLTDDIVTVHEAFVSDSGLKLRYKAEKGVLVMGDSDLIRQAVANLISNAVRYTPEGGKITLYVYAEKNCACIRVSDTGIGLTPEEAKMVFSRFWRADSGRTRASGGLGVGLSVVKEIVDRHNGRVNVEGELGKGAAFTIVLPRYSTVAKEQSKGKKKPRGQKK